LERDWVDLSAEIVKAGVATLVPGGGLIAGMAADALEPEIDAVQRWRRSKREQRALASQMITWATGQRYGDADVEMGMRAAASILRDKAATWAQMAEDNLNGSAITRRVLNANRLSQRGLSPESRDVCTHAIALFYDRLLSRPALTELNRAALRIILERTQAPSPDTAEMERLREALRSRDAEESSRARQRCRLTVLQEKISQLEGAQSEFRWRTQRGSEAESPDTHLSRQNLVAARVALQSAAKLIADVDLRTTVLNFVVQDELQDLTLRFGTVEPVELSKTRQATIDAYVAAQNAVAQALRDLD
jgi:hypothetical protein